MASNRKTAGDLHKQLDTLKRARSRMENQWRVNLSFYKGQQWIFHNPVTGSLENLPTMDGEKPRFRVRITSNHILRASSSLLALLTKSKPVIYAIPSSTDASAQKSAELSESLVEYWWDQFKLQDKMHEALLWGIVAGQGYWKINWNSNCGSPMEVVKNPETGELITDPQQKQLLMEAAQQVGYPEDKLVSQIYTGDIDIQVLAPFQVYLDPNASVIHEAKFAFCQHGLTPEEVKNQFGIECEPDSAPMNYEALSSFMSTGKPDKTLVMVNFYYLPPCKADPKGRYAVWTKTGQDKKGTAIQQFLYDGAWPYPFQQLPLVKFPGIRVPGQIYDASIVEQAIPLQKNFNKTLSQVVEHTTLMVKPQILAPKGSLRKRLTNEPGAVVDYYPIAGQKPEAIPIPSIPTYVERHLDRIRADMDDLFMLPRVQQGSVPPNVEAAAAIDLLQETATDALAPIIKTLEDSIADAGQMMLGLAREYYTDPRLVQITGNNGSGQIRSFRGSEIDAGVSVRAETGSGLPRTRAAKQQRIMSLIQAGAIDIRKAWRYFDSADLRGLGAVFEANQTVARREYDLISSNQPTNIVAARDAVKAIQIPGAPNPQTGKPFQSQDEIVDYLRQESLQPLVNEDYQTHIEEHSMQMNGIEFMSLQPQSQDDLTLHFNLTYQKWLSIQKASHDLEATKKGVNLNYQIKGTTGPTAATQILSDVGVDGITPEIMSEKPLLTWESDSLDDPNPPGASAGNVPDVDPTLTEQEVIVDMAAKLHSMDLAQQEQDHNHAVSIMKMKMDRDNLERQHQLAIQAQQQKAASAQGNNT